MTPAQKRLVSLGMKTGAWSWAAVLVGATLGDHQRRRLLARLGVLSPDDIAFLHDLEHAWADRDKPTSIDRCIQLDPAEFWERFARTGRPVVISGAVDHWSIAGCTTESLRAKYGDLTFEVRRGADYDAMTYRSMRLAEYIDAVERGEDCYMANNAVPEPMQAEIDFPPYLDRSRYSHRGTRLWLGGAGTGAHLHRDLTDNFILTVTGDKRVLLCPPDQGRFLYSWEVHAALASCKFSALAPDYRKYPRARRVQFLEAALRPGDLLYIPCGWYHQVDNRGFVCSINFFARNSCAQLPEWQRRKDAVRRQ